MEEIIQHFVEIIPGDYVLIVLCLVIIGETLKKFTTLPNYLIPTALPILGSIIMAVIYCSSTEIFVITALIKDMIIGLIIGWASTGGYEFFKNTFLTTNTTVKTIETKEKIIEESNTEIKDIKNIEDTKDN